MAMKVETIRFVVQDETEELYFKAVWYLAGVLLVLGARGQVVPALQEMVDRALAEWDSGAGRS
jgi:hypothetical protein